MENIILLIWIVTLMSWITMEFLHRRERQDLYNRLMASNFTDYVQSTSPPPKAKENPLKKNIQGAYRNLRDLDDDE